jgi:hypothetical protein
MVTAADSHDESVSKALAVVKSCIMKVTAVSTNARHYTYRNTTAEKV